MAKELNRNTAQSEVGEELARADAAQPPLPDLGPVLRGIHARVERAEASPWARLRQWPSRSRLWLAWASVLCVAALTLVLTPRADLATHPVARMSLALGLLVALCAPVLTRALGSWHRPALGLSRAVGWVTAAFGTSLFLALLPEAHILLPHTEPTPGREVQQALGCLAFGLACGLPGFVVCWLLGRGAPYSTLVATVVAGLTGNIALQLHCPITQSAHLVAGHSAVGLVALLLVLPVALRPRRGDQA